jgi:hypothetical protein
MVLPKWDFDCRSPGELVTQSREISPCAVHTTSVAGSQTGKHAGAMKKKLSFPDSRRYMGKAQPDGFA